MIVVGLYCVLVVVVASVRWIAWLGVGYCGWDLRCIGVVYVICVSLCVRFVF